MVLGLEFNNLSIIKNECEEEGDPTIMREGNVWSPECPSINEIAASAEIFDILEYVCHVYKLPLALTWILEPTRNSEGKNVLRVEDTACYVNDLGAAEFKSCRNSWIVCGMDLNVADVVSGVTAAEMSDITLMPNSGSSPSASNVDGSNTNNIMGWNMLSPVGDLVEIYETDEKENGESKAILEPASSADKEMVNLDCSKGILSINNGNKSEV
uniref:NLP1-9 GAF domain-containing protein n=1 Tax=Populus alba TaxID=43335 RepID=A0A4U5PQ88_POPAL|nr:uncharacterized protein D5086_0000199880 [Populus alba]